jgi:LysR family glycine cleavage system transcriptional activator
MSQRPFRLPPLNALRVFHAVVRRKSFRAAADELLVSPQAVSHQIKLLEDTLGITLFERKGRVVEPTEQAILLAHYVQAGFDEFEEGVRRVSKAGTRNRINVNVSPYFAARYLLDRIARFRETMPDVDLRLTTMVELPDFAAADVDVAIQWGFGNWPQYDQVLLVRDLKIICCTPELGARLKEPGDLIGETLLQPVLSEELWPNVLRHLGVEPRQSHSDIRIQDAATMRRATLAGLGVGLLSEIDAEEDLKSGKLVAPLGMDVMRSMAEQEIPGFYLVLPKAHRRMRPIAAFCSWVEKENWLVTDPAEH